MARSHSHVPFASLSVVLVTGRSAHNAQFIQSGIVPGASIRSCATSDVIGSTIIKRTYVDVWVLLGCVDAFRKRIQRLHSAAIVNDATHPQRSHVQLSSRQRLGSYFGEVRCYERVSQIKYMSVSYF